MKNRFFLSCFLVTLTSLVILTFASPNVSATALQQEEAGPARTAYEVKLNEWKQMLKDLQQLRSEFNDAKPFELKLMAYASSMILRIIPPRSKKRC